MMYRITLNGLDIYGQTIEQAVISPHLDIELNSAGSLEFTLPVDNALWGVPQVFQDEVEVFEDGKVIFFGRPLQITRDWNNQKKIVCEGALAYFNDSIQRTNEIKLSQHKTLEWFFRDLIAKHNAQVDDFPTIGSISPKHFEIGTIDIPNKEKYVYRKTDYQTTLECLQQMCLDTDGGYLITRREYDEYGNATNYIDWVETMPIYSDQPVQFGINLLDITQDLNGADICTVLMPLGSENCTLSNYRSWNPDDYNNMYPGVGHVAHSDEIYYEPGLELYGRVVQQKTWNDYSEGNENGLWMKAAEWLKRKNEYIPTIEVDAADLHYIDKYMDEGESMYGIFMLGMEVQVISAPHGLTEVDPNEEHPTLIIHKLSLDLDSGVKKITIGTPPKKELTDILAPSAGGSSKRSSGGDGERVVESREFIRYIGDVMVKASGESEYSSTRQNGTVYLDMDAMATGKVKDVQVDGVSVVDEETGIAEIESAVEDVLVDGTSVVNSDHEAEITIPVKGVTYNGIDVVNPNTGIAEISQSIAVGTIQEIYWHERGYNELDPEESNVTVTEPGIYFAIFSILEESVNRMHVGTEYHEPEMYPYYLNLNVSGGRILYQQNINEYTDTNGVVYENGKLVIFENSSSSTVTFRGTNYNFDYIGPQTDSIRPTIPGTDRPVMFGWYEFDNSLQKFVLSEDVIALSDKVYYDKNDYDLHIVSNVTPGVDNPVGNGWYERQERGSVSGVYTYVPSLDTSAVEGKIYYEKESVLLNKSKTNRLRHVFKLSNIDPNWLSFLKLSYTKSSMSQDKIYLKSMVPNDKNVYLIIAMSGCYYADSRPEMQILDMLGNLRFNPMPIDASHDVDTFFYPNSVITSKNVLHIGDGTYHDSSGSGATFNSSNISLVEDIAYNTMLLADNLSYVLIDTGTNIYSNQYNPYITGHDTYVLSFRLSQPIGVMDVQHNSRSIVNQYGIAEIGDVAYKVDVTNMQATLQANFQDGVDSVYNACVSKGSTPISHSLTDVVNGILAIPTGGGGGGVTITSHAEEIYLPKGRAVYNISATATITSTATGGS